MLPLPSAFTAEMFHLMAQRFTQLDFLGGRYYQSANDGMDGNNNATDSLCVRMPLLLPALPFPARLPLVPSAGATRRAAAADGVA